MSFTSGYFSAKTLLKIEDYNNLSKLDSEQFFNYLRTLGFSTNNDIENLYLNEHLKLRNDLEKFASEEVRNFFYVSYDSLNIKQIYKSIKTNKKYLFHPLGIIGENAIYNALKHQDYTLLKEEDKFIFDNIHSNQHLNFKEMSDLVDNLIITKKAMFANTKELKTYLKTEVTLTNILIILRSIKLNLKTPLLPGGYFELSDVKEIIENEERFQHYLSKLFVGHLEKLSLNNLEKLFMELKVAFYEIIRQITYTEEGIVLSYVYKKFIELENLKKLYIYKNMEELIILWKLFMQLVIHLQ